MQWISVQESLPPDGKPVLVLCQVDDPLSYMKLEKIYWEFVGIFNRCRGWYVRFAPDGKEVFYWMPLPYHPKEEKEK